MDTVKHELSLHAQRKGWNLSTIQNAEDYLDALMTGQDGPDATGLDETQAEEIRALFLRFANVS
jgi:hypothetical protein